MYLVAHIVDDAATRLEIPEKINGYAICEIGFEGRPYTARENPPELERITLEERTAHIEYCAFKGLRAA